MKSPRRRSQSGTAGAAMRRERESRSPRAHERERGGRHPSPALSPSLLLALSPPLRRSFLAFEGDKGFRRRPARSRAFPSLRIRPEPAPAHAIQPVFATAQDPSRARSATEGSRSEEGDLQKNIENCDRRKEGKEIKSLTSFFLAVRAGPTAARRRQM